MGNVVDLPKRDLLDSINAVNEQYMKGLMNVTSLRGAHIGYHQRDLGSGLMQRSPVWQFTHNGTSHYMAAFYDHQSDQVIHTLLSDDGHATQKRQDIGFEDERWKSGGMDFKICEYNTDADRTVLSGSTEALYDEIGQDLACLIDPDSIPDGDGMVSSVMNGASVLLGQIFMTTYNANGDASSIGGYGTCGQIANTMTDQTCQY